MHELLVFQETSVSSQANDGMHLGLWPKVFFFESKKFEADKQHEWQSIKQSLPFLPLGGSNSTSLDEGPLKVQIVTTSKAPGSFPHML